MTHKYNSDAAPVSTRWETINCKYRTHTLARGNMRELMAEEEPPPTECHVIAFFTAAGEWGQEL